MKRLVLVMFASCARFEAGEPIELIADPSWSTEQVARLAAAGECWNLAFNTQFSVVTEPTTQQSVRVGHDNLVCIHAAGQYTFGVPARIDVCPDGNELEYLGYDPPLFMVLIHELGHAAGIRTEGTDELSVMGLNGQAYYVEIGSSSSRLAFSAEDARLFGDANPDFEPSGCESLQMKPDATAGVRCECPTR